MGQGRPVTESSFPTPAFVFPLFLFRISSEEALESSQETGGSSEEARTFADSKRKFAWMPMYWQSAFLLLQTAKNPLFQHVIIAFCEARGIILALH